MQKVKLIRTLNRRLNLRLTRRLIPVICTAECTATTAILPTATATDATATIAQPTTDTMDTTAKDKDGTSYNYSVKFMASYIHTSTTKSALRCAKCNPSTSIPRAKIADTRARWFEKKI